MEKYGQRVFEQTREIDGMIDNIIRNLRNTGIATTFTEHYSRGERYDAIADVILNPQSLEHVEISKLVLKSANPVITDLACGQGHAFIHLARQLSSLNQSYHYILSDKHRSFSTIAPDVMDKIEDLAHTNTISFHSVDVVEASPQYSNLAILSHIHYYLSVNNFREAIKRQLQSTDVLAIAPLYEPAYQSTNITSGASFLYFDEARRIKHTTHSVTVQAF